MSVNDNEHSGRPSTGTMIENVAKVPEVIQKDQRCTIHDICNIVRLSHGMCQRILSDELNMRHIAAEFVPRLLSNDQKEYCIAVCTELKEQAKNNRNFISNIITGDKPFMFGYNPEKKLQLSHWKTLISLQPKKA
jgi:hypothetical protein